MSSPQPIPSSASPILKLRPAIKDHQTLVIKSLGQLKNGLRNSSSHVMQAFRRFKEQITDGSSELLPVADLQFESKVPMQNIKRFAESLYEDGKLIQALFILELCYNQLHQVGHKKVNPAWLAKCLWGMTVVLENVKHENILKKYVCKCIAGVNTIENSTSGTDKIEAWSKTESLTALANLQATLTQFEESMQSCKEGISIMKAHFEEPEKYQVYGRCFAITADSVLEIDANNFTEASFWYEKAVRIYSRKTFSFIDRSKDLEYGNVVWCRAIAQYLTPSDDITDTYLNLHRASVEAKRAYYIFMNSKDVLLKEWERCSYMARIKHDHEIIERDLNNAMEQMPKETVLDSMKDLILHKWLALKMQLHLATSTQSSPR
jgi:hypothetical protein